MEKQREEKDKIGVSACLLGYCCKYNGKHNLCEDLLKLEEKFDFVPICPEVMGGLPTPRVPSEIIGDKVINQEGIDVTDNYNRGAKMALDILKENNVKIAILKSKSPSCGMGKVYDGTFSHTLIDGNGITTKLFLDNGIKIYNENNFMDLLK